MPKVKTSSFIIYRTSSGKAVPGVTTILSVLNKPALVGWANRLGLQGIDVSRYVDDKAAIGTLAHHLIVTYLEGIASDTSDYTQKQIDKAETCLIKFWDWEHSHTLKTLMCERPFVSDTHQFGGTIDWYGELDGKAALIDFKTTSGVYPEMSYQLAAYRELLFENHLIPDQCHIIRVGRDDTEGFEDRVYYDMLTQWQIFEHCLAIYSLQKGR